MSDNQHNRTSVEPQAIAASLPQGALGWADDAQARPGIRVREAFVVGAAVFVVAWAYYVGFPGADPSAVLRRSQAAVGDALPFAYASYMVTFFRENAFRRK